MDGSIASESGGSGGGGVYIDLGGYRIALDERGKAFVVRRWHPRTGTRRAGRAPLDELLGRNVTSPTRHTDLCH